MKNHLWDYQPERVMDDLNAAGLVVVQKHNACLAMDMMQNKLAVEPIDTTVDLSPYWDAMDDFREAITGDTPDAK